jgi:MFS superfamily sulfate permease-like transporter
MDSVAAGRSGKTPCACSWYFMIHPFHRDQWFSNLAEARKDVLAGIVVALALIPEAIGFSVIAGVDPRVGRPAGR